MDLRENKERRSMVGPGWRKEKEENDLIIFQSPKNILKKNYGQVLTPNIYEWETYL